MTIKDVFIQNRPQFLIMMAISVWIISFSTVGFLTDALMFQRWIGGINPIIASFAITLLGGVLFWLVIPRGWFSYYSDSAPQRFLYSTALATLLAGLMIFIDLKAVFPRDLNVLFPDSIWYYSAVSYVVEILFHVLPLSILIWLMVSLTHSPALDTIAWLSILIIALIEPSFQTSFFAGEYPAWVLGAVWAHLFVFNLIQLSLFKQYDFVAMFSFRLVYYFLWHIVWGHYRLSLLF